MKAGELKKLVCAYGNLLPDSWRRVRNEFLRREGDWVQIVTFNTSRWADKYAPRSCFEFLKMTGVPTGGFLLQELHHPNGTQRWIKLSESPSAMFEQMAEQFKPALLLPLHLDEVKRLLRLSLSYWPHAYALCVMSCESGNIVEAKRYLEAYMAETADKPYPWAESRRQELEEYLKLTPSPEALKARLDAIREDKLRALKLVG